MGLKHCLALTGGRWMPAQGNRRVLSKPLPEGLPFSLNLCCWQGRGGAVGMLQEVPECIHREHRHLCTPDRYSTNLPVRPGSVVQTQLPCVLQPRGSAGTAAAGGAPGPALCAEMGQQRYSPAKGTAQGLLSCASENRSFSCHVFLSKCCTPKQAGVSSKELPLTSSLRTMSPSPSPSPCAARPPLDHRITES